MRKARLGLPLAAVMATFAGATGLVHATPPAGSEIVNQASISFVDGNGNARDTLTNEVILTVNQVFSATIERDRIQDGAPAQAVRFLHRVTNTGNGPDQFRLSVAQDSTRGPDSGDFDTVRVFQDLNGNGQVDVGEPQLATAAGAVTTLTLDAGEFVDLIVRARVPGAAGDGSVYDLTLTAQAHEGTGAPVVNSVTDLTVGAGNDGLNDTNEDRVNVTLNAVLQVTKSSSYDDNGTATPDDDAITYTVTVQNFGQTTARDIILTDSIPANTTFDAATGVTSPDSSRFDFPNAGTDDGANGAPGALPSHDGGTPGVLTGEIDFLPTGNLATFVYRVTLNSGLAGGLQITNTATADGDLDLNSATNEDPVDSNTVVDIVPAVYAVDIIDTGVGANAGVNDGGDDDSNQNDTQFVDVVNAGETVIFTNIVTNNGTVDDTFNLALGGLNEFPTGTVFRFFAEDGFTPLLDTNRDSVRDTGILAPGASRTIVVKAILPPGETIAAPVNVEVVATSTEDPAAIPVNDNVFESLGAINAPQVDIANSSGSTGFNDGGAEDADPASAITTTLSIRSGGSATFDLFIANEGSTTDNYDLAAAGSEDFATPLPQGWRVVFRNAAGADIIRTPNIAPGAVFQYTATVSVPDEPPPPSPVSVFFRAQSSVTGVFNVKQDAVLFDFESIDLTPDQFGAVVACGSTDYTHILSNDGDTQEDVVLEIADQTRFTSQLLFPTASAGGEFTQFVAIQNLAPGQNVAIFDNSAGAIVLVQLVSDGAGGVAIPLDPLDFTNIKVKVIAPCSAGEEVVDVLTLEARVVDGVAVEQNTDRTTVGDSLLTISKKGALDAACDGTPDGAFQTATVQAAPNECVIWQLVLVNQGNTPVCEVTATDSAPSFTLLEGLPSVFSEPPPGTGACAVNAQSISCTAGNDFDQNDDGTDENFCLQSGEQAEVRFGVRLNPP